jgi:hypothetical protein
MHTPFEPYLLQDKTRLPEVFMLRVNAWENSPRSHVINSEKHPNGYFDNLEYTGLHWVAENEQGQIIAAARGNVLNSFDELPYPGIVKGFVLPTERPFFYFSRLVVNPDYRKLGLANKLDLIRLKCQAEKNLKFGLAIAANKRVTELKKRGFACLGEINACAYKNFTVDTTIPIFTPPLQA